MEERSWLAVTELSILDYTLFGGVQSDREGV